MIIIFLISDEKYQIKIFSKLSSLNNGNFSWNCYFFQMKWGKILSRYERIGNLPHMMAQRYEIKDILIRYNQFNRNKNEWEFIPRSRVCEPMPRIDKALAKKAKNWPIRPSIDQGLAMPSGSSILLRFSKTNISFLQMSFYFMMLR